MVSLTDNDPDGVNESYKYPNGAVIRVFCLQTDRDAYPSGWIFKLHYSVTEPDPPTRIRSRRGRRFGNRKRVEETEFVSFVLEGAQTVRLSHSSRSTISTTVRECDKTHSRMREDVSLFKWWMDVSTRPQLPHQKSGNRLYFA